MLNIGSYLRIVDNSGAKLAKCLKNIKKNIKQTVSIGDLILVVLKNFKNKKIKTCYLYWISRWNKILINSKRWNFC